MKNSRLQFKNPKLLKLNYELNNDFKNEGYINLDVKSKTSIKKGDNIAIALLELNVFDKNSTGDIPFYIDISMGGQFFWDGNFPPLILPLMDFTENECNIDKLEWSVPQKCTTWILLNDSKTRINQMISSRFYLYQIQPFRPFAKVLGPTQILCQIWRIHLKDSKS